MSEEIIEEVSSASGDGKKQRFLNPLTIEAVMFLKTLDELPPSAQVIDSKLLDLLETIVLRIQAFVNSDQMDVILPSKAVSIVEPTEVKSLERHFVCVKCLWDLGVSCNSAALHLIQNHKQGPKKKVKSKKQKKKERKLIKLPKHVEEFTDSPLDCVIEQHIELADNLRNPTNYEEFNSELKELMVSIFPEEPVTTYIFGSRFFGLGTKNSDLDVYVDIGNNFNNFENVASVRTLRCIDKVCEKVNADKSLDWSVKYFIRKARVPIVRLVHCKWDLECDIGFSNSLGYCNSKLIEYIFKLQPVARRVCMFFKIIHEKLNLGATLTNYTMILMVIFMLQLEQKLPAIETLQKDMDTCLCIGPWIGEFKELTLTELEMPLIECNSAQTKLYIRKFLQLYTGFRFDANVVCPYLGRVVNRTELERLMPDGYKQYVYKKKQQSKKRLQMSSEMVMVVQDPIQLNHNVAKAMTPRLLKKMRAFFISIEAKIAHEE